MMQHADAVGIIKVVAQRRVVDISLEYMYVRPMSRIRVSCLYCVGNIDANNVGGPKSSGKCYMAALTTSPIQHDLLLKKLFRDG